MPTEVATKPAVTPDQAGLLILPESLTNPAPPAPPAPPPDSTFVAHIDAALADLGARADRYSVELAMRSELAGFASLHRCLKAANCSWFGVDLDPVSLLRDDWALDEILSRLGGVIRHVRARDALLGAQKRTQPAVIGTGNVPWNELTQAIRTIAYRGFMTIDPSDLPNRTAAAASARAFLQESSRFS